MSDARWYEAERHARATEQYFGLAVRLHEDEVFHAAGLRAQQAEMALMHAMQSGHTSLESTLLRLLKMFGEEAPDGPEWHRELLDRAAIPMGKRPAILDRPLLEAAQMTRSFRHRAMHDHENFRHDRAGESVEAAALIAGRLVPAIAAFRVAVDP